MEKLKDNEKIILGISTKELFENLIFERKNFHYNENIDNYDGYIKINSNTITGNMSINDLFNIIRKNINFNKLNSLELSNIKSGNGYYYMFSLTNQKYYIDDIRSILYDIESDIKNTCFLYNTIYTIEFFSISKTKILDNNIIITTNNTISGGINNHIKN